MIGRIAFAAAIAFSLPAFAAAPQKTICKPIKEVKGQFPPDTAFTSVTPGQLNFLRGVAVLNPQTPPGVPPGTGAVVVQKKGDSAGPGIIFFVNGSTYCTPMAAPPMIMKMLMGIPTGAVDSDGQEM